MQEVLRAVQCIRSAIISDMILLVCVRDRKKEDMPDIRVCLEEGSEYKIQPKLLKNRSNLYSHHCSHQAPASSLPFVGSHGKAMLSTAPSSLLLTVYAAKAGPPGSAPLIAKKLPPQGVGEGSHAHFASTVAPAPVQNRHGETKRAGTWLAKAGRAQPIQRESNSTHNCMYKSVQPHDPNWQESCNDQHVISPVNWP